MEIFLKITVGFTVITKKFRKNPSMPNYYGIATRALYTIRLYAVDYQEK